MLMNRELYYRLQYYITKLANVNLYSNAFEYDKLSDFQNMLQYFFNWKDRKRQKVVCPVFLINGDAK